jgi:hypothetical protein
MTLHSFKELGILITKPLSKEEVVMAEEKKLAIQQRWVYLLMA